ncbi:MAG: hypothetical protein ACK6DC_21925 [Planctomycetota bacterium]
MRLARIVLVGLGVVVLLQCSPSSWGQNIMFTRQPGGDVEAMATTTTAAIFLPERQFDTDFVDGADPNTVYLPGLVSESVTSGSNARGIAAPFVGEITAPEGVNAYVPEHELAAGHMGWCNVKREGATAQAMIATWGQLLATYATRPGTQVTPSPTNQWATMSVVMQFIAVGPPQFLAADPTGLGAGFFQDITIGDSDLTLVHLGNGVFNTFGAIAASNERSAGQFTRNIFIVDIGSVNRKIPAQQRVPINSGRLGAVGVFVAQGATTLAARAPIMVDPGSPNFNIGSDSWIWSFNTSTWFYAEDLVRPDTPRR